jgi:hypothetical protein
MRFMASARPPFTIVLGMLIALSAGLAASERPPAPAPEPSVELAALDPALEAQRELLQVRRIYVDKFGGGETASQVRDMVINALHASGLFAITENEQRADAVLRGSAEDLVFTDVHQSSDSLTGRLSFSLSTPVDKNTETGRDARSSGASVGENESQRIQERQHEASAAVRLLNKDGDVIWATTQESLGGKFRGASADVALKISKQLRADYLRARELEAGSPVARKRMPPPSE